MTILKATNYITNELGKQGVILNRVELKNVTNALDEFMFLNNSHGQIVFSTHEHALVSILKKYNIERYRCFFETISQQIHVNNYRCVQNIEGEMNEFNSFVKLSTYNIREVSSMFVTINELYFLAGSIQQSWYLYMCKKIKM